MLFSIRKFNRDYSSESVYASVYAVIYSLKCHKHLR